MSPTLRPTFAHCFMALCLLAPARADAKTSAVDLRVVCQLVLDLDLLQGFLHPEVEGRVPLVVVKNGYFGSATPELNKHGKPVVFLTRKKIDQRQITAYIEFTRLQVDSKQAKVAFRYDVEGVVGQVSLEKKAATWKVIHKNVVEQDDRLRTELGKQATDVLRAPDRAWAGQLKTEAVIQAENSALTTDKRVAGYPVIGELFSLSAENATLAGNLIADEKNHRFDVARRCNNRNWVGFRFQADKAIVEVALGKPCDQVVVVWKAAGKVRFWGGILRDKAASELRRIANPPPMRAVPANKP